jgi:diguanylate cyclase (GGDEF)-like protein/PAS domain S-box-containing protein
MVGDAVVFVDRRGRIVDASAAAAASWGYGRDRLRHMRFDELLTDGADGRLCAELERVLRGESLEEALSAQLRTADGAQTAVRVRLDVAREGGERLLVALVQPESDAREDEPQTAHAASRDYLTRLPTRAALSRRLARAERRARQGSARFAVLFIDADGLKAVNDEHGHRAGDLVLQALGRRLRACMRPGDFVARWGGDEFVALIEDVRSASEVARIARRVRNELRVDVDASGSTLRATVSVGAAVGDGRASAQAVLDEADRAMYDAKRRRAEARRRAARRSSARDAGNRPAASTSR